MEKLNRERFEDQNQMASWFKTMRIFYFNSHWYLGVYSEKIDQNGDSNYYGNLKMILTHKLQNQIHS